MGTLEAVLEESGYRYDRITEDWIPRQPMQINRLEVSLLRLASAANDILNC
jgi:hypothetical protein